MADAGYSSGENYAWLEKRGIESYIPPHGTYKGGPESFTYNKEANYWECPQGKQVTFRKQKLQQNRWHKSKRMSTVEPVFGTPINFLGMRKVNTRGIQQANKCMLMAATAFNLKKLLKYAQKPPESCANLM